MDGSVEQARISAETVRDHQTFLPLSGFQVPPPSATDVCTSIGLNWLAALKLHESGWLSFDPKLAARLDPTQETELRFLGSLVSAGCDENLLKVLLSGLKKPYSYRAEMIYYDWTVKGWSILPTRLQLREMFLKWLDDLAESAQIGMLEDLRDNVNSAIREIRGSVWW